MLKLRTKTGNSLVEYVFPLSIVGLVLLVSLPLMIPDLRNSLMGYFHSEPLLEGERSLSILPAGANPYTQTLKLVLDDGTIISLPNYPTSLSKTVETEGTNGTTDLLADTLMDLAKKLLADKQITEAQYNQFEKLSNAGHTLAGTERLIEEAALSSGKDKSVFMAKTAYLEGFGTQNVTDLSALLTISDSRSKESPFVVPLATDLLGILKEVMPTMDFSQGDARFYRSEQDLYVGRQMQAFLQEFKSLKDMGALNNPALRTLVQDLSGKISNIALFSNVGANDTALQTGDYNNGSESLVFDLKDKTPDRFKELVASSLSNAQAANICSAGGGQDTGVYCPKNKN